VNDAFKERVAGLSVAKALTVAAYGESVAAYRYRTLAEKTGNDSQRRLFVQIADEEQGHHAAVQELLLKHFPDSDFILTAADKELVIVGPRMLDLSDDAALNKAMPIICESERRTGEFYAALSEVSPRTDLQPIFRAMAHECFEHAEQVALLADIG
jgi:rubrerythrin